MTSRDGLAVGGLVVALGIPLVVALVVLHDPHWIALHDLAQVEMRVRDVSDGHPPQLGLGGRIQGYGQTGSHPGPVSFYVLWPVYELLGASGWALQAAAGFLSAVAAGLSVWIAHRRGGTALALAATAVLAVLLRGYGAEVLTSAWNPHMPLVWWWVFLLAVWSVLCGDLVVLPVMVFAGVLCAETHIPYVLPVAGLGLLTVGVLGARARRDPEGRRPLAVWGGAAVGLLALLVAPPLVEEVTHDPGNLSIIVQNFRHPYAQRVSKGQALDVWLEHLDVVALLRQDTNDPTSSFDPSLDLGARLPGLVLLAAWGGAVVLARRRRDRDLLRLHLVVAVAEATTLLAISRIFGPVWPYLVLSAWGTTALMVLATVWTARSWVAAGDRAVAGHPISEWWLWPTVAVVALAAFAVDSAYTENFDADEATAVEGLSSATAARLDQDRVYLLVIDDSVHIVSPAFGFLLELEKRGYDVRAEELHVAAVRSHRVAAPEDADAVLEFVVGADPVTQWRARPDAELLAEVDPPSEEEPPIAVFLVL